MTSNRTATGEPEGLRLSRLRKLDTSRIGTRVQPRIKPRGVPPALRDHLLYSTIELKVAESMGRSLFGRHRLSVLAEGQTGQGSPGATEEFCATWHAVRFRDVTLGHLDYGAAVEVVAEHPPKDWMLIMPMNGSATVSTPAGMTVASPIRAALPTPDGAGPLTLRCESSTSQLLVIIEHQALVAHLRRLLGRSMDEPLVFDQGMNLAVGRASRWNFAIQMLHAELLDSGSLIHQGVGIGQLEEFLMSSLLFGHRSNYSRQLEGAARPVEHRVTRAAQNFIEMHLAEPLQMPMMAEALGVSVRTIETAFRADLDTTPTTYIRDRRLERIRADLADAEPGSTVTETALRWGMVHLGRFAADYRARFGEAPSRTLRH